jgi:hypothetical protein
LGGEYGNHVVEFTMSSLHRSKAGFLSLDRKRLAESATALVVGLDEE